MKIVKSKYRQDFEKGMIISGEGLHSGTTKFSDVANYYKNKEAAKHLLDSVESIYDRLVENPYQFPKSRDMYLAKKGYYEAVIPQMNYIVIFDVRKDIVNIVGIFHQLENYLSKL